MVLSGELPFEGHLCSTNESICITGNSCCAIRTLVQYPAVTWKIHGYPSRRRACDVMGVLGCTKFLQDFDAPATGDRGTPCWMLVGSIPNVRFQTPTTPPTTSATRCPSTPQATLPRPTMPTTYLTLEPFFAVERRIFRRWRCVHHFSPSRDQ